MGEPSMSTCFPYDGVSDATCAVCGAYVMNDQWNRHVNWHVLLWNVVTAQPA
jgi:hypothetical protein